MDRRTWLGAAAVASLMLTGCAASAASAPGTPAPEASHTMPDGTEMPGSEHDAHGPDGAHDSHSAEGPSEAAQMICAGQVPAAVAEMLALEGDVSPSSTWDEPTFTCTYDVDGAPLTLSVHDVSDSAEGEAHFAELQESFDAEKIEGLLGLGMPSFSTGEGVVGFLRDGKTLLVDATALPDALGSDDAQSRHNVAYAVASAVLVCWVDHS